MAQQPLYHSHIFGSQQTVHTFTLILYYNSHLSTMEISTSHNNLLTMASCTVTDKQCIENPNFYCEMSPFLIHTVHLCSLILSSFCFIDTFWFIYEKKKCCTPKKKTSVTFHPPPPYTSLEQQLSSVPKVTIVERFDCICNLCIAGFHLSCDQI